MGPGPVLLLEPDLQDRRAAVGRLGWHREPQPEVGAGQPDPHPPLGDAAQLPSPVEQPGDVLEGRSSRNRRKASSSVSRRCRRCSRVTSRRSSRVAAVWARIASTSCESCWTDDRVSRPSWRTSVIPPPAASGPRTGDRTGRRPSRPGATPRRRSRLARTPRRPSSARRPRPAPRGGPSGAASWGCPSSRCSSPRLARLQATIVTSTPAAVKVMVGAIGHAGPVMSGTR